MVIAAKAAIKGKGYSLHSALLGHADPATTVRVYGHVVPGAQERAVASIGAALEAAKARRKTAEK